MKAFLVHDQLCLCHHSHAIEEQCLAVKKTTKSPMKAKAVKAIEGQSLAVKNTTKSPKKAKAVKAKKVKTPKAKKKYLCLG